VTAYVVKFDESPRHERTVALIQGTIDWLEATIEELDPKIDWGVLLTYRKQRRSLIQALVNLEAEKNGEEDWVGSRPVDPETGEYLPGGEYRLIE